MRHALIPFGLFLFVTLATLNSAGYRYGASDQAFYAPAVIHRLHPDFYPRDRSLIESQAHLTLVDETVSALARATRASVPSLFAALYVSALVPLALVAGLTMRHGIARTGTNSLEGYFHPRQLAFALGAWGLLCFVRGQVVGAALFVAAGALIHPTTAAWFGLWLAAAWLVSDRRRVVPAVAVGVATAIGSVWALTIGPLAGRLGVMDQEWVATLAAKNYLFPLAWPWTAWAINLGYPLLVGWLYWRRRALGLVSPRETAIVAGAGALFGLFLISLPFNAARVQLAIQLQPGRIFWMLDFLATIYAVWGLAEGRRPKWRRARMIAGFVCLLTLSRGLYVAFREFPDRPMFAVGLPDSDWTRIMAWARASAPRSHWLADPGHASRYGTSVRVAGERDVLVEASKDQAIGMYQRDVAIRTRDRIAAVGDFSRLTPERARALASSYDLNYLVTDQMLELPVVFTAGELRVYSLAIR